VGCELFQKKPRFDSVSIVSTENGVERIWFAKILAVFKLPFQNNKKLQLCFVQEYEQQPPNKLFPLKQFRLLNKFQVSLLTILFHSFLLF